MAILLIPFQILWALLGLLFKSLLVSAMVFGVVAALAWWFLF